MLYRLTGTVIHGKGLGRKVGLPTANLDLREGNLPPFGVYASIVYLDNKRYIGVTNVGYRPSVDSDRKVTIETNILDFSDLIYGKEITLDLLFFLRPTRKMANLDEVKKEVILDIKKARELIKI